MGRANLIGNGPQHLIPSYQPRGTGEDGEGRRLAAAPRGGKPGTRTVRTQPIRTQHTGLPLTPRVGSGKAPQKAHGRPAGKAPGKSQGKR